MSREKQIEFERNDISDIIAHTFEPCGKQYDASDFEWSAHCLQMSGYHKQEWISVEERLPETTCECLAVGKSGCIFLLCYSSRYMAFNATDGDGDDRWKLNDITHWMPLPEPPKGE